MAGYFSRSYNWIHTGKAGARVAFHAPESIGGPGEHGSHGGEAGDGLHVKGTWLQGRKKGAGIQSKRDPVPGTNKDPRGIELGWELSEGK